MAIDNANGIALAEAARQGDLNALGNLLRDLVGTLDDLSDAEIAYLDGLTPGAGAASKALVLGTNGEASVPGELELDGNTLAVEGGTGVVGVAEVYETSVVKVGGIIKTEILIDLTGLRSTAAGDIIGDDGTANPCHIGQITAARNGTIVAGMIKCLEVPAGGDPDIDLYSADEGTGVEDAAVSGLTETQLVDSGDHTLGGEKILTAFPAADQYLYLVAGSTTDADYTAGKLLITLWGYDA